LIKSDAKIIFFFKKIKDITLILRNQAILFDFSHFLWRKRWWYFSYLQEFTGKSYWKSYECS